ncbi:hypothetical protein L6452_00390 [Arctium lappa]|uniref:Uncharacterized protein n=1 Tax=Arctium lappa TaxID=4217 RepID=A0ACB9FDD4_ARCLA|nr:hypothetical protein L6452_00390 [Arctium lappa]
MGRSGLSSKRKHSKKKNLKASSEGRRKKRSSRNKSKKLRRHDDSFSSCSDDASTSSSLVSSSSSEDEYRSRRARSHRRNEVKGSRKRSRKQSLSDDSGKTSPPVKKRKGSKKKTDSQTRKKNKIKKKKSRRDAYISSASSDSASCSTFGDGNSSSDEGASLGRRRSRSREKKKDHRDSIRGRKGHRKDRSRSRSSSPSKLSNSCDDDIIEKVMVENNSRRLKSIITVAKLPENEEGNDMKRDELKEEIVYDYDDYPSCKSNDSNDGESKKELDRSEVSPEKRRMLTSVIGEVNSSSSLKDSKSVSPSKNASRECVGLKEKESNASGNIGSEVDNLESILRQKALENLSRFRGGIQTKPVVPVENKHKSDQSGVKQSIIQTPSRLPAAEQDSFSTMAVPQPIIPRSRFTWRRDPSVATGKEEKAATNSGTESGTPQALAPKLQTANLSSTPSVENKTSKSMDNTGNDIGDIETNDGQKATNGLETKEGSSKEQQTESNNSQFEKKTMSVMRGGEMVQVSYKVYIPNRAPALARRQLKR